VVEEVAAPAGWSVQFANVFNWAFPWTAYWSLEDAVLLARVIGTVVASEKSPGLEGIKFLIVQPLDKRRRPKGEPVVACDGTAQAGPGHVVTIVGAREASQALPERFVPVDWAITSIVDMVDLADEKEGYREWRE
jgi:ethanolamine utilization protein EutN